MIHYLTQALSHIDDLTRVEQYLFLVGRIHDIAGVDLEYIGSWALRFCARIDRYATIEADVWKHEVKEIDVYMEI